MGEFIKNIKQQYKHGSILIKLIFINVFVFIALNTIKLLEILFKVRVLEIDNYIGIPANVGDLANRPWTIFTYMFAHYGVLHLLFNMLLLFGFGRIFLTYFNQRNLGGLYVLGGLGGALLYLLAFNSIPYFIDINNTIMIGASASVTAIIFASAFYRPNTEVQLLLIGRVKIVYIAVFIFIIDFLAMGSPTNPGGHVAHIGGAIVGYFFAIQYKQGKDLTKWMNIAIDRLSNLFKPRKGQLKVKITKTETDYDYNKRKYENEQKIDLILDKLKASGYNSLSKDEKKQLFDASKK